MARAWPWCAEILLRIWYCFRILQGSSQNQPWPTPDELLAVRKLSINGLRGELVAVILGCVLGIKDLSGIELVTTIDAMALAASYLARIVNDNGRYRQQSRS